MSTLPATSDDSQARQSSARPAHQNAILLFVEALVVSLVFVALPISALASHYVSYPLGYHLGFLSITSALTLFSGVISAVQRREMWVTVWHVLFQAPFFVELSCIGYAISRRPFLDDAFSEIGAVDRIFVMLGSVATTGGLHTVLKLVYSNMAQAAARENDQAGLMITHLTCRWIGKQFSVISTFRQRRAGLASLGGAMALQPLGCKLKAWISRAAITQNQSQVQAANLNKETTLLLGDDMYESM